ncbi:hypothetical protein HN873_070826 [Arachis hypogaea]
MLLTTQLLDGWTWQDNVDGFWLCDFDGYSNLVKSEDCLEEDIRSNSNGRKCVAWEALVVKEIRIRGIKAAFGRKNIASSIFVVNSYERLNISFSTRQQVHRVQSLVDTLDALKARNANPFSNSDNSVKVTTQWETFDSEMGNSNVPPLTSSSTKVIEDWERFD